MKTLNLSAVAVVLGWILVIGGLIATVDMLLDSFTWRSLLGVIRGPMVTLSVGLLLWLTARR